MTTKEILIAARALIEKPEHWMQGAYAAKHGGVHVDPWAVDACAWCAWGAVSKFTPLRYFTPAYDALKAVVGCLPDFNDDNGTTHAEVLAAFDRAIAAA